MELSNPVNLLSTKLCSPMIVYLAVVVVSLVSVFFSRNVLKRFKTQKMENLLTHMQIHEAKFLVLLGIVLFGMCQYNKSDLAWILLFFPVVYVMLKNIYIFAFTSLAHQNAPKEVEPPQQSYGISPEIQKAMMMQAQLSSQQNNSQSNNSFESMNQRVNKDIGGLGLSSPLNNTMGTNITSLGGPSSF